MINNPEILVRRANASDTPFLIKTIIEADKSGTFKSSYCWLLGIEEDTLAAMLSNIFMHELEGFEFAVQSFCVIEQHGKLAGACAAWIEALDGIPSWQTRMLSIRAEADSDSFNKLLEKKDLVSHLIPDRTPLTLQIESVYIDPGFRGMGLFNKMVEFHVQTAKQSFDKLTKAEILVYDNNKSALHSYIKAGFEISKRTKIENDTLITYLPSDGMILLSKNI